MAKKKKALKPRNASTKPQGASESSPFKLGGNELRIKYSDSHDLQDKLLSVAQSLSRLHTHMLLAYASGASIKGSALNQISTNAISGDLGPQLAFSIVTGCVLRTDLNLKLGDIPGYDPLNFQACVESGVREAGFTPGTIPTASSNTLFDVFQAVQNFNP